MKLRTVLAAAALAGCALCGHAQMPSRVSPVASPDIPAKVCFDNQTYDLNRIDMYERFEREMTAMCYTHSGTLLMLKRANRYFPEIAPVLQRCGVPADLIYVACIESMMNPRAVSPAKAAGIWQFMPATAREYGLEVNDYVDERYNIEKATEAAARMLRKMYNRYGNWESAFAAYNGGPARISRELENQDCDTAMDLELVEETSRYMFRVLAMKMLMENPPKYGYMLRADQFYTPMEYDVVEVSGPVDDWTAWAKKHGLTFRELKEANLWIRANSLPNKSGKTYRVRVPKKSSLYRSSAPTRLYNINWAVK